MDAAKRLLRADMREVRRRIAADPADRAARSARIWARIVSSTDLGADRRSSATRRAQNRRRVMLYDALPGEPDSGPWAEWCRAREIDVFTPEVDGPELRVMPGDMDPATLDFVLVPGLAFTTDGHRLGQGGGHFDRFLPRLRPDCLTIGVCYREQLVAVLPMAEHDVHVALVVTDTP
jgi:5-formyltetrahydrofolate cyclo-ligase